MRSQRSGRLGHKATATLVLGSLASGVLAGPCDIYKAGNTPCVAAHSSTRALYAAYTGSLYQVKRGSDGGTTDIHPLSAGGVANAATQESFCSGSTCVISILYDQSGNGNHLTQAPKGGAATGPEAGGADYLAGAGGAPVTLGGKKAYGVFGSPMTGYRNNNVKGTAKGDQPQGMYAVFDGTHYNDRCCFDYGNAEIDSNDTGNGHMEALYFGTGDGSTRGTGAGSGPWIMADLENGLFSGYDHYNNQGDPSITSRFVTAILKGKPGSWALRGGDSSKGGLSTYYNGIRPSGGYDPMNKEGSIILGIGGDNSDGSQGTFYEGVMTSGYPSDDVENQVQQNIVQAGYATTSLLTGPALNAGSHISMRVTSPCCTDRYVAHSGANVATQPVSGSSPAALKQQASWIVRTGLGNSACWSFESVDSPGQFIRHSAYALQISPNDGTKIMHEDATFCSIAAVNGQGNSFRSWSYPARYIRHFKSNCFIAGNGSPHDFDTTASFNDDVSFVVSAGFA